jgi:hypothetical protein
MHLFTNCAKIHAGESDKAREMVKRFLVRRRTISIIGSERLPHTERTNETQERPRSLNVGRNVS